MKKLRLIDINKDNWLDVIFLTTNNNRMPTLCEEYVTSNAFSLVQAQFESWWVTKAIEYEGKLIGFAMYGFNEETKYYELCRMMVDKEYQGEGYGKQAVKLVLDEMKTYEGCKEVYLSTDPHNNVSKHVYEQIGFKSTGKIIEDEEQYCLSFG